MDFKNDKPTPKPAAKATPKAAAKPKPKAKVKEYEVLAEITVAGKMPGVGTTISDVDPGVAEWLLAHNYIRVVED